jgi:hypothetical protein
LYRIPYILLLGVKTLLKWNNIAVVIVGNRVGRLYLVRVKCYILPNYTILLAYYTIIALILQADALLTPCVIL